MDRPISVYDQSGRRIEVGREAWRRDVLLPGLAASRNDPDTLHGLLRDALRDDFAFDVLEYARHLADTDPQPRRGALLLGAVLLQLKEFAAARDVLERAIARHGDDPRLLTSLARALAELGDAQRAEELIWRALQLDPNDEAAFAWFAARSGLNGGQVAMLAVYARAAMLPGSWRAHLALARAALARGDAAEATRLYEEALGRVTPPPAGMLAQMSGDLGEHESSELLVRLTGPHFDPASHGLAVANNLLRAFVDLGQFAEARKLLERLLAQQRAEWREQLVEWQRKLDDAQRRHGLMAAPADVIAIRFEQPVWSNGALGFDTLLPRKSESAPRIHLVCASVDGGAPGKSLGRITRALPLFLAEELYLCTRAKCVFVLPWMKQGGFILSPRPWTGAALPADAAPPDLLVFTHIEAAQVPWAARLTLEQPLRSESTAITIRQRIDPANVAQGVVALLETLVMRVSVLLALQRQDADPALAAPDSGRLSAYLVALEYALAIGLGARDDAGESFQRPERAVFQHLFETCENGAGLLRPRMLLVNALERHSRRQPDVVREYLDKLLPLRGRYAPGHESGERLLTSAEETLTGLVRAG